MGSLAAVPDEVGIEWELVGEPVTGEATFVLAVTIVDLG